MYYISVGVTNLRLGRLKFIRSSKSTGKLTFADGRFDPDGNLWRVGQIIEN
jgi:hypothetical protein